MSICSWNDSHGTTCKWPGPFSADTHGGGRYYCVWHWRAFGLDRLEMKSEGDRIVRDSYEWDGSPESYLARRIASQARTPAANAGTDGGKESQGPRVEGKLRNDAQRNAPIPIAHAALAGLGGDLQPEYGADF